MYCPGKKVLRRQAEAPSALQMRPRLLFEDCRDRKLRPLRTLQRSAEGLAPLIKWVQVVVWLAPPLRLTGSMLYYSLFALLNAHARGDPLAVLLLTLNRCFRPASLAVLELEKWPTAVFDAPTISWWTKTAPACMHK